MSLLHDTPFERRKTTRELTDDLNPGVTTKGIDAPEQMILDLGEVAEPRIIVGDFHKASEIAKIQGEAFIKALESGKKPMEAAREVQVPLKVLMGTPKIQKMLGELLSEFNWSATVRRDVARAKANKIMLEGDDKDAINAIKIVAADPEVGISNAPSTNVQVNIIPEAIKELAERVDDYRIEGLED